MIQQHFTLFTAPQKGDNPSWCDVSRFFEYLKRPFARGERCFLRALSFWVSIANNLTSFKTFKISAVDDSAGDTVVQKKRKKRKLTLCLNQYAKTRLLLICSTLKKKSFTQKLLFAAILKTCSAKIAIKVVLWEALFYTTQKGNGLWRAISVYRVVTKSRALCACGKWTWGSTWHLSHKGSGSISMYIHRKYETKFMLTTWYKLGKDRPFVLKWGHHGILGNCISPWIS